jgi:DUF4097 and DUF4098 domain-containing protein YvlB
MNLLLSPWLKLAIALLPVFSFLMPAPGAHPSVGPRPRAAAGDVREEINKTITLAPGSQVTIRGINGGVEIETWNGNQAEIHIEITASSREALERRPLLVENTADSLTIRTLRGDDGDDDRGYVRHRVRLRLPTSIHLKASSVNGGLEVGEITGAVAISSINGGVRVAQAGSATEITSVNGRVTVSLTSLGDQGLRISSINGGIELRLPATTNAELEVRSVNGGVDTDFPVAVTGMQRRGELRGTLGSGGARIAITSVNGGVHLKRL